MLSISRAQLILGMAAFLSALAVLPPSSQNTAGRQASTPLPDSQPSAAGVVAQANKPPEFFVAIDPSHGGDDRGAMLPGRVQEKDLTLSFARELRRQLAERGIQARLLRETDVNLTLERRAEEANAAHAGIYLVLHAGGPGEGTRIYSAAIPAQASPGRPQSFLPWDSAQSIALARSRVLARAVSERMHKDGLAVSLLTASLRPLNNVVMPALAIEWAPGRQERKGQEISKAFARLSADIASAIADLHDAAGGHL